MFHFHEKNGDHDQMQKYAEKIAVKDNIDKIISQPSLTSLLQHNGNEIRALNKDLNQKLKQALDFHCSQNA